VSPGIRLVQAKIWLGMQKQITAIIAPDISHLYQ